MAARIAITIVLLHTLLKGSISAESGSCPKEVVNITATLTPGWKHVIQSPRFPNDYPPNATCTWRVTLSNSLPSIYRIGLTVDTWEIETCTSCSCDYLIYGNNEMDVRGLKCHIYSDNYLSLFGSALLITNTRGHELWMRFRSDQASQFKGFRGQLKVINENEKCHNYINSTSGSIASPKYPSKYPKDQSITWCLAVPSGFRVKLKFSSFELEDTRNKVKDCVNDFVEVRDGGKLSAGRIGGYGELLGRFCGNTIPTEEIYSISNQMWVQFVSDSNATTVYKGFRADFVNASNLVTSSIVVCLLATMMWLLM